MSSFRGARHLLSIGCHSIKCSRPHQRRIVSLGLTSLCQVTMKKQALLDINTLPVNKFDLSSVGILSPTLSSLFSTTALIDDDASEVTEEQVFIGGHEFNHDRKYLHDLFKQFGDINRITIPLKNTYNQTLCRPGDFRFGFVTFKNSQGARNALRASTVTASDGKIIEIKERSRTSSVKESRTSSVIENEHTFVVSGLPEDINIHQIHDYFKSFGDVRSINLILKSSKSYEGNYAFVMYKEGSNVNSLHGVEQNIAGNKLMVEQANTQDRNSKQSRGRCKMILLSGMSKDITVEEVCNHFNGIGSVRSVSLFTDDNSLQNGLGVVHFYNKEDAISAAELCLHDIGTSHVKARLLGILNE